MIWRLCMWRLPPNDGSSPLSLLIQQKSCHWGILLDLTPFADEGRREENMLTWALPLLSPSLSRISLIPNYNYTTVFVQSSSLGRWVELATHRFSLRTYTNILGLALSKLDIDVIVPLDVLWPPGHSTPSLPKQSTWMTSCLSISQHCLFSRSYSSLDANKRQASNTQNALSAQQCGHSVMTFCNGNDFKATQRSLFPIESWIPLGEAQLS